MIQSYYETDDPTFKAFTPNIMHSLLDFGFRGVSSLETATLGSAGYLTSFEGTDTCVGVKMIQNFYNTATGLPPVAIGSSIPASEHSTITSWSDKTEDEWI